MNEKHDDTCPTHLPLTHSKEGSTIVSWVSDMLVECIHRLQLETQPTNNEQTNKQTNKQTQIITHLVEFSLSPWFQEDRFILLNPLHNSTLLSSHVIKCT